MKSERSSKRMLTGEYITKQRPHTLVSVRDNSGTPLPDVTTFGYNGLQAIYSPKGITNQWIFIEGDNVLAKYDKLFGKGNTNLYGSMGSYARRYLEGGFGLNVMNVAPEDATHANVYTAFVIKPLMGEDGVTPVTSTMYCYKDADTSFFKFAKTKEELALPASAVAKEISYPEIQFGFESRFINEVGSDYDPELFMSTEDLKIKLPVDNDLTKLDVNIPIFGLFYEGATEYGNNFKLKITDTDVNIQGRYPLYKGTILDKDESEFEFNFTLFDTQHEMSSTSFRDNVNRTCKMNFTEKNSIKLFRPYLLKRKIANKAKKLLTETTDLIVANFLAGVKVAYPDFDEAVSESNVAEFTESTLAYPLYYQTQDTEAGRTVETPFSVTTPWTEIDMSTSLLTHTNISRTLVLEGGSSGKLKTILNEEEFGWDIKYNEDATEEVPVFIDMMTKAYSGVTDPAIFDQALVPHSLLCGDGYPIEVQMVMEELTRNKPEIVFNDSSRVDFTYFRTPQDSVVTFADVLKWYETMISIPDGHNTNCKLIVGRGVFSDDTTGGQNTFELIYDWFGANSSLASWLKSGTGDSFASDNWSDVISVVAGTETLLPGDTESESLSTKDINYFTRKSDKTITLGEDTAMYLGYLSILKNLCTTLHFNSIVHTCTLIARDNPIIDPTSDNINKIKRKMEKACTQPAKHFGNTLKIDAYISTHEMELNKNVVVYEVSVEKGIYSRQNKVVVNANLPSGQ